MGTKTPDLGVDLRKIRLRLDSLERPPATTRIVLSGVQLGGTPSELRCTVAGSTSSYVPIRASSFPTGSSREIKEDIVPIPFDSVAAIKAARAMQWRYQPEYAMEDMSHIGPMAEDLPAALVTEFDGVRTVDLLSLVGVLWDAVGKLTARVEALEGSAAHAS